MNKCNGSGAYHLESCDGNHHEYLRAAIIIAIVIAIIVVFGAQGSSNDDAETDYDCRSISARNC